MSQYNLVNYKIISITPFDKIMSKDMKCINEAYNISDKSDFTNAYKIGACISSPKGLYMWSKL